MSIKTLHVVSVSFPIGSDKYSDQQLFLYQVNVHPNNCPPFVKEAYRKIEKAVRDANDWEENSYDDFEVVATFSSLIEAVECNETLQRLAKAYAIDCEAWEKTHPKDEE